MAKHKHLTDTMQTFECFHTYSNGHHASWSSSWQKLSPCADIHELRIKGRGRLLMSLPATVPLVIIYVFLQLIVFCKYFSEKMQRFWTLLHVHFGQCCSGLRTVI